MNEPKLGVSGGIAKKFLTTEITPLLALVGLLLGLFAVMVTPREEDPQINVTFANVFIPFPGASAEQVESLVSTPAEQVLSEIEGLEHIYSISMPGMSVLTVQYKVGEERTAALVRLYNKIASNQDWLPKNLGVGTPLIKPKGIDDVPIVALTLWTDDEKRGAFELNQVAHAIEAELKRVPGTRDIYTIGGPQQVVHVLLDADKLAGHGISLSDLRSALQASNSARDAVSLVNHNEEIQVQAGTFLMDADEVGDLMVGVFDGKPVFLRDVAEVKRSADSPEAYVSFGSGVAAGHKGLASGIRAPAVTVAVAKQPGTNAVDIANNVIDRFEKLRGTFVPEGVKVTVTRNYGETAQAKSEKLIHKLIIETIAVVLLIWLALGWREALIVGAAVIITLAVTLFASWAYGFTLNRVSLFALIFSIGILVDDAIVVVENIHRHMQKGGKKLLEVIPLAVDEVGGPTILATFTVIAALLPMAFVSGLMGPYMSPIPINASMGMLISLAVAYVVTPWMTNKMLARVDFSHHAHEAEGSNKLKNFFSRIMSPFLDDKKGGKRRATLFLVITLLIALSASLAVVKLVVLKMLPFDNKSEFQVVLDMPEGTSLEQTSRILNEMADYLGKVEDVTDYQIYAGTAAPINFNGLVRQYYLREGSNVGDIQVNLTDAHERNRQSHAIALDVRPHLQEIAQKYNGSVKVVEVPPGPPVMSPIVAEVYGLDYPGQIKVAKQIRGVFEKTDDIVDIDDSVEYPQKRLVVQVDRSKAALLGVSQDAIASAVDTALHGEDVVFLHGKGIKYAVPIRLEFPVALKDKMDSVLALRVRSQSGELVPMSELVNVQETTRENSIYHKDLLPVVYVMGDMAGKTDSPLYGMFSIFSGIQDLSVYGNPVNQHFIAQPDDPYLYGMKWDGEWQVTYETFRDMGIAYGVGMILIFLLIVAQFRSYMIPLVIMSPIPLTIIGVMPGHALLGAQFTATSMIGMIALAGIIVRNSILLVDFINEQVRGGMALKDAVINSSAVRAKPIALTALAAMVGAFFIIDDPIFGGLAVSLIFGILVSTVLTLVLIPLMYYMYAHNRLDIITGKTV
ncbi:efflux RND transporter permease subunit [Candidatus Thiothrix sp. Deng01]|uniref:Efflux RND transporter permease subunit n=1 Tax=Candidatus Thiothrix phosphatis TaxID=3112415 RepID=A0ABU6D0V8_9GAMM|nr:efflux RND transporter permease subunit [Candidatus Thiothrix sp. Deng01]MEB4592670.1 efflux RND transporter permease subunit [Candidatus Thiothrix sp. Deng01]